MKKWSDRNQILVYDEAKNNRTATKNIGLRERKFRQGCENFTLPVQRSILGITIF